MSLLLYYYVAEEQTEVIEFDKPLYEVYEDIGKTDLAVRVCINIFNLISERTIRIMTVSGTAVGMSTKL